VATSDAGSCAQSELQTISVVNVAATNSMMNRENLRIKELFICKSNANGNPFASLLILEVKVSKTRFVWLPSFRGFGRVLRRGN